MSHVPGSESGGHGADVAWLYRQNSADPQVAGGDPPTLLLPMPTAPPTRSAARVPVIILIGLLLCLTVGAIAGMVLLLQSDSRASVSGLGESAAPSSPGGSQASTGKSVTPTQATVGCQAPQTTDDAGHSVYYAPGQMFDARPNTAWRCNGNGIGQVIIFTLPDKTTIDEVGLVNGYAKVDPASGAKRYGEYRRITEVTWTFANGSTFEQSLEDGVTTLQQLSIPPQPGDTVTLTINASSAPGSTARGRNAVLISEVSFSQP
jgi:hypothetical protein